MAGSLDELVRAKGEELVTSSAMSNQWGFPILFVTLDDGSIIEVQMNIYKRVKHPFSNIP